MAFHSSCKFWYRVCEVVGVMEFLRICGEFALLGVASPVSWWLLRELPLAVHNRPAFLSSLGFAGALFDLSDLALTSKCFGQAFSGVQVRILCMLIPDGLVYERFYLGTPLVKGR